MHDVEEANGAAGQVLTSLCARYLTTSELDISLANRPLPTQPTDYSLICEHIIE